MSTTETPMLEMRGITKRFPGVIANEDIDFDVRAGEVHTLLGENGAGKSTLMKILFGLYQPDEGEVLLGGQPANITSPSAAIDAHIGMVHQHFMLVPTLTVAENVALGIRSERGPLTDLDAVSKRVSEISEAQGLALDPSVEVWRLSVGERQRIEIVKALFRDATLLVLDEPTAVLTPQEVDDLFVILRRMTDEGRGLVFISHKLHEVMALSDRITVLRNGRVTGQTVPAETSREQLAEMMVGRAVKLTPHRPEITRAGVRLVIKDLSVRGDRGTIAVHDLNLEVEGGEILGIAGVSGNGQRELAEAVAGLRAPEAGSIALDGNEITKDSVRVRRDKGVAYVPEERMRDGAIGDFTVSENLILVDHGNEVFSKSGLLNFAAIREHCTDLVERFAVKTPTIDTPTSSLSGGNIQKVIMARELTANPSVLVCSQPTRGVDIGSAEYIHERLIAQREEGTATLLISEDLDEVLGLSDRIAVMFEGRVVGIVDSKDATREGIGLMMAGVFEPA
ncbi:MAG: ABC transporter ATP-binding protein [Acidimicrobiales bacterium]